MFVTFEGLEGSGKTTQIERLRGALRSLCVDALFLREPGSSPLGLRLRELLLDPIEKLPITEALIVSAARAELVANTISPALKAGQVVICDRYVDSTLTIQGYGLGHSVDELRMLCAMTHRGVLPDLTFYFDVDPAIGAARKKNQPEEYNHMDERVLLYGNKLRAGYRDLIAIDPGRWRVYDATRPVDDIATAVLNDILSHERFPLDALRPALAL